LKNNYFKSKVFKKLFFSYIIIISLCFGIYYSMAVYETAYLNRERKETYYELMNQEVVFFLDQQLGSAKNICSSINSSALVKTYYLGLLNEDAKISTYMMYQMANEIAAGKTSSGNLNIAEVMLFMNGSAKAYISSDVVWLKAKFYNSLKQGQLLSVDTIQNLLGFQQMDTISFNKKYLIYIEDLTCMTSSSKGLICILFNLDGLSDSLHSIIAENTGVQIMLNDETIYQDGVSEGRIYERTSMASSNITYRFLVPESEFKCQISIPLATTIIIGVGGCILFVILSYYFANRYYMPIGNIEEMIKGEARETSDGGIEHITEEIQKLIGERNGYREKMITIAPYAEQGMLHGILNGSVEKDRLNILWKQDYMDLKKPYFTVSAIDIAYLEPIGYSEDRVDEIKASMRGICKAYSNEEMQLYCYEKNRCQLFLVVNSDEPIMNEELFFQIHQDIQRENIGKEYAITMGVDAVKDDIAMLEQACSNAMHALNGMLLGGRNSVYFYEQEADSNAHGYYFPKDAVRRLTKALKDRKLEEVDVFFEEVQEKNRKHYDLTCSEAQLLVEEIHFTVLKVLKEHSQQNTTHITIDPIKTTATLDEIITYYKTALETICNELQAVVSCKQNGQEVDDKIVAYIKEHYKDDDISLAKLTQQFGVSNKYITLCCKQRLGATYLQYIQNQRIEYAKELFQSYSYSVEQVAQMCGYTNILTFRRNFRAITGMNPSDFRQE